MSDEEITIMLVDGPADGRTFTIRSDRPPMLWRVPIEQPITALWAHPTDLTLPPIADYEPLLEGSWPSRTDDGTYRYRFLGTPPSVHPPQTTSPPTLAELADMIRDPAPSAYPTQQKHLLACRTRHSLRRDAQLTQQERAAIDEVTVAHIRESLAERRRTDRNGPGGNLS